MIYSTFINSSSKGFYLYKPLLPSNELLKETVFGFQTEDYDKNKFEIEFVDSTNGAYYEGNRKMYPFVIPELKMEKFLLLPPNDSLTFILNASKFYSFKSGFAKKTIIFSVGYSASMPFVNSNYIQAFENIKGQGKEKKPVFYNIGMQKAKEDEKYLYQRTYFRLK